MVNPKIGFSFHEVEMEPGITCTVLEVPRATGEPTRYGSVAYARIGSNLKPLSEYKEVEARLWRTFETTPPELRVAAQSVTAVFGQAPLAVFITAVFVFQPENLSGFVTDTPAGAPTFPTCPA